MDTRDEWLTRQLETLQAHVREERQRREREKRQQALMALVALNLPEMILADEDEVQEPGCLH
jgi:hypothetical protein